MTARHTSFTGNLLKVAFIILLSVVISSTANAQYQQLYQFPLSPMNGGIILDRNGNIYGATSTYPTGSGIAFELVMPGPTLNVLHSFTVAPDGVNPNTPLAFDHSGNLYGTTVNGGRYNAGTVFELSYLENQWRERVLYSFTGAADGGNPRTGVVLDNAGHLYGTTQDGGRYGTGVVYRLNLGTVPLETVLHAFGGPNDAQQVTGNVIRDSAGNLYGEAIGGAYQAGIVYKLSPVTFSWAETILYAFEGTNNGAGPNGGVAFDTSGNLYGMVNNITAGCGAAFELSPSGGSWTESVIHVFQGPDGCSPIGPPTFDSSGNLYIVTETSGANQQGTIDKLTPSQGGQWTETTLFSFPNNSSLHSNAGLVFDALGNLYGTENVSGYSAVYEFTP